MSPAGADIDVSLPCLPPIGLPRPGTLKGIGAVRACINDPGTPCEATGRTRVEAVAKS